MNNHRSVNIEVATRQCFGGMFEKTSADQRLTQNILSGQLHITPHPSWRVPEKLSWIEDPFQQRNWRAQLHMLRWLEPLRRSGMNGDIDAADRWIHVVKSWVESNPRDHSAADFAWADMVEAIRSMCMVFGLPLAGENNEWLLKSIWEHGEWLSNASHIGKANHALHQHQALFIIGRLFDNEVWVDTAVSRLMDLFAQSYDDQGVNVEGSLGYHKNNYIWWRTALRRLSVEGIECSIASERLDLALVELAHATRPDGKLELIGDTETTDLSSVSAPQLDYIKSAGAFGEPPKDKSTVYRAGYAFGRSGWGEYERDFEDELYYSLSFGPQNRIHGHCDGGSITLHSNRQPWLVDAGKYAYKADAMRDYCLSRLGHNVIVIEGSQYDPSSQVELVSHTLSTDLDEYVLRDAGYEGVVINRHVVYCRAGDFFVVVDTVKSTRGCVTARQRWHLDPQTKSEATRTGYKLLRQDDTAEIRWSGKLPELSVVSGQHQPFDGWISTKWMEQEPAEVLQATKSGERFRFITLIFAAKSVSLEKVVSSAGAICVSAGNSRNHFQVTVQERGSLIAVRGAGATDGGNLSEIRERLAGIVPNDVSLPSALEQTSEFTTKYWQMCKSWLDGYARSYDARLKLLEHLLNMVARASSDHETPDYGLRSAVIDVAGADIAALLGLSSTSLGILREPLIEWPGTAPMTSQTYKSPIRTIDSPNSITVPPGGTQITTAQIGAFVLPMLTRRGTSDRLIVRFHGALNRGRSTLPIFQGLNSSIQGNDSFVIFQDPCLDLNRSMSLSWYLGDLEHNIHEFAASYVIKIRDELDAKEIVLMGGSGGGFTALQVSTFLPDAKVLVFNPQTDVRAYHSSAAETALMTCFGQSVDSLDPSLVTRASCISAFEKLSELPQVLYVQNSGDIHHVRHHRDPFERMLKETHPEQIHSVRFVDEDWGPGHVSPTAVRALHFQNMLKEWQLEPRPSML